MFGAGAEHSGEMLLGSVERCVSAAQSAAADLPAVLSMTLVLVSLFDV